MLSRMLNESMSAVSGQLFAEAKEEKEEGLVEEE